MLALVASVSVLTVVNVRLHKRCSKNSEAQWCAALSFTLNCRLPPKVPLPAVVAIDREKIIKLDDLVGRCCTILSARELANIVSAKEVHLDYLGEPFQELLIRFQANASVDLPAAVQLADQENQLVGRFLAEDQSAIRRIWNEKS
uniref:Uncharacterized protein n=1 Tax=Ditylenchus dipsaci TaxID=166011 RepID=A0A915CZU3_9BILA